MRNRKRNPGADDPRRIASEIQEATADLNELLALGARAGVDTELRVRWLLIPCTECRPPFLEIKTRDLPYNRWEEG